MSTIGHLRCPTPSVRCCRTTTLVSALALHHVPSAPVVTVRPLASATAPDEEQRRARHWRETFTRDSIPRQACEISFSRSSGPGGQNVNKTNSKATLRIATQELRNSLPPIVWDQLRRSRYFAARSNSILLQADESRRQAENVELCYRKLYGLIIDAADEVIRNETSADQARRVREL